MGRTRVTGVLSPGQGHRPAARPGTHKHVSPVPPAPHLTHRSQRRLISVTGDVFARGLHVPARRDSGSQGQRGQANRNRSEGDPEFRGGRAIRCGGACASVCCVCVGLVLRGEGQTPSLAALSELTPMLHWEAKGSFVLLSEGQTP